MFTGGIGENDASLRAAVCARLGGFGISVDPYKNEMGLPEVQSSFARVRTMVVPTNEGTLRTLAGLRAHASRSARTRKSWLASRRERAHCSHSSAHCRHCIIQFPSSLISQPSPLVSRLPFISPPLHLASLPSRLPFISPPFHLAALSSRLPSISLFLSPSELSIAMQAVETVGLIPTSAPPVNKRPIGHTMGSGTDADVSARRRASGQLSAGQATDRRRRHC